MAHTWHTHGTPHHPSLLGEGRWRKTRTNETEGTSVEEGCGWMGNGKQREGKEKTCKIRIEGPSDPCHGRNPIADTFFHLANYGKS